MGMPFQGARNRTEFRRRCPRLGLEKAVGLRKRHVRLVTSAVTGFVHRFMEKVFFPSPGWGRTGEDAGASARGRSAGWAGTLM